MSYLAEKDDYKGEESVNEDTEVKVEAPEVKVACTHPNRLMLSRDRVTQNWRCLTCDDRWSTPR